jgi:hypothetical protein
MFEARTFDPFRIQEIGEATNGLNRFHPLLGR